MNKSQLKAYAPKARRDFIQMVRQRADVLGLTKAEIAKPEVQGDVAVIEGRPYPRRYAELHTKLAKKIEVEGLDQFLDRVAYSWFNRFAALRFMEVNGYLSHPFRVLSNRDAAKSEPEILEHAAEVTLAGLDNSKVIELKLAGNKDAELYKLLIVAQCNELHATMPFLFERINDETELLLPDNVLHSDSVIRKMVSDIDEENWKEVEIVGWLYQFYISEKKDEVIGKTVKSEDIPAATQLFTPNWIVKYMVQNSLGRLWLEARPDSELKTKVPMEFYIEPAEANETIERDVINPEEITVLDPACGSGHILVEAYDLLKAIYIERGYSSHDIPELILKNNLFGLEIDERAAQLASFALLMKVREDDRNLFEKDREHLVPNIIAVSDSSKLEHKPRDIAQMFLHGGTTIDPVPIRDSNLLFKELQSQPSLAVTTAAKAAADQLTETNVTDLLELFEQGQTLGSLIRIPDGFEKVIDNIEASISAKMASPDLMEQIAARQLVPFVRAAKMLARKYDCVIANPPYMGSKGMNAELKAFAAKNFPDSKADLFAMFIERNFETLKSHGFNAMVTMQSWMFLSSFESMREKIVNERTIITMAHLGARAFVEISGEVVQTTTFIMKDEHSPESIPTFFRLVELNEAEKVSALLNGEHLFRNAKQRDFEKIPGSPIAYWTSSQMREVFFTHNAIGTIAEPKQGLSTCNNDLFLRYWFEIDHSRAGFKLSSRREAVSSGRKWFPYNKGGSYRKWFGNNEYLIDWQGDGLRVHQYNNLPLDYNGAPMRGKSFFFRKGMTWSSLAGGALGGRLSQQGFIFDAKGPVLFSNQEEDLEYIIALFNSKPAESFLKILAPTLDFNQGPVGKVPFVISNRKQNVISNAIDCIDSAAQDWDSFETSWEFKTLPILDLRSAPDKPPTDSVEECWNRWNELSAERISHMQELETENNRLFIDAYGLQDELSPDVPLDQITLARADKEKDTRRLLSYFIGCLMGRYSLDESGLIYADADNAGFDASRYRTFPADEDGIVPVTDMEWFPQEAARQFENFVRTVWGETKLNQNLGWIAQQLGTKAGEVPIDTIRRYFSQSFFKDHMQTYKKRPIYWLFSSGKLKAFECLVYLHRYNESTLPRMRHEYVLPLMSKLEAQIETLAGHADEYGTRSGGLIDTSTSTSERNKLTKQLETLKKKQVELAAFDEKLRHYADMRITLDLDDGVKVNYGKFGDLLAEVKTITGTKD